VLDNVEEQRWMGLHGVWVHGPSGLRNRTQDGVVAAQAVREEGGEATMGRDVLQMSLFGPGIFNTVELTELYGQEPGGIFDIPVGPDLKPMSIRTCYGDLVVIINVLEDYARILSEAIVEWNLEGFHRAVFEIHGARLRRIAKRYAEAIGYNYEEALVNCKRVKEKKWSDNVGEDALVLAARGVKG